MSSFVIFYELLNYSVNSVTYILFIYTFSEFKDKGPAFTNSDTDENLLKSLMSSYSEWSLNDLTEDVHPVMWQPRLHDNETDPGNSINVIDEKGNVVLDLHGNSGFNNPLIPTFQPHALFSASGVVQVCVLMCFVRCVRSFINDS